MEDIYSNSEIEFHKKKINELMILFEPIRMELAAHTRELRWQQVCRSRELVGIFGWRVDRSIINVRYTSGVKRLVFAGVDENDGSIMLKEILKNKKPSMCVCDNVELRFIEHPPIK